MQAGMVKVKGLTAQEYVLMVLVLLAPVVATQMLLPTFHIDTAETVMWGRYLPWLGTHKHPPVMGWFGAIVEMLPGTAAWQAVALQIVLNLIAVAYFHGIGGFVLERPVQKLVTVGLCVSMLMTIWPVAGYALNADVVAIPFWAGALYHIMAAKQAPQRLLHWLMAAVMLALSLLTKYFAVLLAAGILIASLVVPSYRRLWKSPWPYVTLIGAALLVSPHVYWALHHLDKLAFIAGRLSLHTTTPPMMFMISSVNLILGFALLGLPLLSLVTVETWWVRRSFRLDAGQWFSSDDRQFLFWVMVVFLLLALASIGWGILYQMRFSGPIYGVFALLWFMALPLPQNKDALLNRNLRLSAVLWALAYIGFAVVYLFVGSHNYAQEPARAAALELKAAWNSRFTCGPAYLIGERRPAQVLSVYYGAPVMGVPFDEIGLARWYDAQKADDLGAIYVVWSEAALPEMRTQLAPGSEIFSMEHARLRTQRPDNQRYWYAFQPPKKCG